MKFNKYNINTITDNRTMLKLKQSVPIIRRNRYHFFFPWSVVFLNKRFLRYTVQQLYAYICARSQHPLHPERRRLYIFINNERARALGRQCLRARIRFSSHGSLSLYIRTGARGRERICAQSSCYLLALFGLYFGYIKGNAAAAAAVSWHFTI